MSAAGCRVRPRGRQLLSVVLLTLLTAAALGAVCTVGYPWHASCSARWTLGRPCDAVRYALVEQMRRWSGRAGCAHGGQRCLYTVTTEAGTVTGTHTTPTRGYVDDIRFQFTVADDASCAMEGVSRSRAWYAYLDFGTNYCNMNNLIIGAGLDQNDANFTEATSDSICTQYSSADCDKY